MGNQSGKVQKRRISQPFVFGGKKGPQSFDPTIRYRGSLQNFLIDTGDEVILVDTGLPAGTPEEVPEVTNALYTGKDICSYMEVFAALGYKPEQATTILLTHKHGDHSGDLRSFPNEKIHVNEEEISADELQGLSNIVPVRFTDGAFYRTLFHHQSSGSTILADTAASPSKPTRLTVFIQPGVNGTVNDAFPSSVGIGLMSGHSVEFTILP